MIMRKEGKLNSEGHLVISGFKKYCPFALCSPCSTQCAQFDTITDNGGREIIGAYLGCIDKQWVFKRRNK